ncbi:hypothetical protein PT193_08770 [Erysipelothrix rhusiopathiae]|nr:hypothetical protein [Erysipelothrix rhusiopathiae]MDE8195876.1 hypothetical protein [Erysipelothrix rhusiopathiae]MDE8214747.1 hypothetical protein [Erysipelothrix rhusiopathiae]MDE8223253.1 hypothetical protein [Erysipelothrix rhusiopathiae]MDE8233448.1 hypothetical protein [Erysipelothrix rhusiopathiae]
MINFCVSEQDAHEIYDVKIKEFANGRTEVKIYDKLLMRKKEGLEPRVKQERAPKKRDDERSEREIRNDSLHRSYSRLMDLALQNSNSFSTFITLTFAENIKDLTYANKQLANCLRNIKRVFPDLMYLGVPEFQKRGAVHYHFMTNIPIDLLEVIEPQKNKKDTKYPQYNVIQWKHGFSSVFDLKLTDDNFSVAAYLTKYFYKDIDKRLFGRKKILKSINLLEPQETRFLSDSKEYDNYMMYLSNNKKNTKKKRVIATNDYAQNMTILTYE